LKPTEAPNSPPQALSTVAMLPGCATTTASVGTDAVACSAFEPIAWSRHHTDATILAAKEYNAAWAVICHPKSTSCHLTPMER